MASSQGIQFIQQMSIAYKYHFLRHILRFLFFFSDNIMADVASKQQTTALFLSTTVNPHKKTHKNEKLTNLCSAREQSVQFFVQVFKHT
jgi:hypothetical protein